MVQALIKVMVAPAVLVEVRDTLQVPVELQVKDLQVAVVAQEPQPIQVVVAAEQAP